MTHYELRSGKFDRRDESELATPGDVVDISERQAEVFNQNGVRRFVKVDDAATGSETSSESGSGSSGSGSDSPETSGSVSEFLDRNVNDISSDIESGAADTHLSEIRETEESNQARKTVLNAVDDREAALGNGSSESGGDGAQSGSDSGTSGGT